MGKFCTQCGRPLNEGEVCSCMQQNQNTAVNIQPQQEQNVNSNNQQGQYQGQNVNSNYQQGQYQGQNVNPNYQQGQYQGQNVNPNFQQGQYQQNRNQGYQAPKQDSFVSGESNVFSKLLLLIKSPVKQLEAVGKHKYGSGYGSAFIVAAALLYVIWFVFSGLYVTGKAGSFSRYIEIPYFQISMMILIFMAGSGFARAGILYLVDNKILHGETGFGTILVLTGVKSLAAAALGLLTLIGIVINAYMGMFMFLLMMILPLAYSITAYTQISKIDADKKVLVVAIVEAVMAFVNCILISMFISGVQSQFSGYLQSLMGGLY